ncbi:hypothetical protein INR77_06845 [Erythrobacter sp. SCSIO 43205]|uniref:hypothetical protein n=1 Tax=Erythrobacter sp. SCSIO 43205 TaxID=2779361 RepID=UPI001CA81B63|nr:hypothetical protein [Erythrobacter sp. SCSIO 43205]UAB79385.1 hypothetical protein INR77_06845 [Erythrobacter sp. SCSIO 43205]
MMYRASLMACVGLFALSATSAHAAVDEYTVEPSQRLDIALDVCSAETQLAVRGTGETDLDFEVTSPSGENLVSDAGIDDYISLVLTNESEGCAQFSLSVSNLGEQENDFTLVLEPIVPSSTRVKKYIVQGNATEKHKFRACGTAAKVDIRGDGDTDLDFVIRNSDGGIVHEDDRESDETSVKLEGLLSDCETFELEVTNIGAVYNAMMVVIEPQGADPAPFAGTAPSTSLAATAAITNAQGEVATVAADSEGPGEYTAPANTRLTLDLPVCEASRLEVRGNGASDLDFILTDGEGDEIHSDTDLSDVTFKSLTPKGGCETFGLAVTNLGEAQNIFRVTLIDPASRVGDIGAGEYTIGAQAATKVPLQICEATKVSARGRGDTDLDFDVTDASGSSIHSDYGLTDATEFTLDPQGKCQDYQISVNNLGTDKNVLTIAFGEEGDALGPRKRSGPFVAGPTRPNNAMARPGQIVGFRKGEEFGNGELNRNISLLNRTGEALTSLFWSNSATIGWGKDMLTGSALARGQQWNIEVTDGSAACLFDFRAITESEREIEVAQVNVCEDSIVAFE